MTLHKNHFFILLFIAGFILFAALSTAQAVPVVPLAPGPAHAHHPVIHVSRALRLNAKKELIADITAQVKAKDNVWASIHDGEYVRVTYEQVLDRHYDNAVYARPSDPNKPPTIEVYPVYTDQHGKQVELPRIAAFPPIKHEGFYRVLLTRLPAPARTFDFKITGGVDIDYIVDPTFTDLYDFGAIISADGAGPNGSLTLSGGTLYGMTPYGGAGEDGMIFSIATGGGTLTDLYDFGVAPNSGQGPYGNLTLSGSTLYGMAEQGGASGYGIIFSIATSGGTLTDLHDFSGAPGDGGDPAASLTLSGSTLYGMTNDGGVYGRGIIFSIATTGGTLRDLHNFSGSVTDGSNLSGNNDLTLSGSSLYGMTLEGGASGYGIIFSIATTGGALTDLHNFSGSATDGAGPEGDLTLSGSTLYGMTSGGGTSGSGIIFSIATTGGALTDLHNFSGSATDGAGPEGDLTLSGSTLYGMAEQGGASGYGIIFSIATSGGTLTDLHDFSGSATDGKFPYSSYLTLSGGMLYSMTSEGGTLGEGVIFSIATTGGTLTDLHNFTFEINGAYPSSELTISGSTLYGMTDQGGVYGNGIIFSIATSGGTLTDLHDFSGSATDGIIPSSSCLLTLSGSTLYGMTNEGGASSEGIIFSIATTGGTLTDLHNFSGSATDGGYPHGSLTLSGNTLYGMTSEGGASGDRGIIFSIATSGGTLSDLHNFSGSTTDGQNPFGSLTLSGSTLYGMTWEGGASSEGIIFSIATTGGTLTDLHNFSGSATDGLNSFGSLTLSGSTLYGMTSNGGASDEGIIFSIATTGGPLRDMHDFSVSATDGAQPSGDLTLSGSTLYGMTSNGGASSEGIIFSIATTGGTLTDLHDFSGSTTDGEEPGGDLTLSGSTLYGMAFNGGANEKGILFAYYSSSTASTSSNAIYYGADF